MRQPFSDLISTWVEHIWCRSESAHFNTLKWCMYIYIYMLLLAISLSIRSIYVSCRPKNLLRQTHFGHSWIYCMRRCNTSICMANVWVYGCGCGIKDNNFCHYLSPTMLMCFAVLATRFVCVTFEIYADFCGRFGSFVFHTSASLSLLSSLPSSSACSRILNSWPLLLDLNQINFQMVYSLFHSRFRFIWNIRKRQIFSFGNVFVTRITTVTPTQLCNSGKIRPFDIEHLALEFQSDIWLCINGMKTPLFSTEMVKNHFGTNQCKSILSEEFFLYYYEVFICMMLQFIYQEYWITLLVLLLIESHKQHSSVLI